jgi:hypothetical protein
MMLVAFVLMVPFVALLIMLFMVSSMVFISGITCQGACGDIDTIWWCWWSSVHGCCLMVLLIKLFNGVAYQAPCVGIKWCYMYWIPLLFFSMLSNSWCFTIFWNVGFPLTFDLLVVGCNYALWCHCTMFNQQPLNFRKICFKF